MNNGKANDLWIHEHNDLWINFFSDSFYVRYYLFSFSFGFVIGNNMHKKENAMISITAHRFNGHYVLQPNYTTKIHHCISISVFKNLIHILILTVCVIRRQFFFVSSWAITYLRFVHKNIFYFESLFIIIIFFKSIAVTKSCVYVFHSF